MDAEIKQIVLEMRQIAAEMKVTLQRLQENYQEYKQSETKMKVSEEDLLSESSIDEQEMKMEVDVVPDNHFEFSIEEQELKMELEKCQEMKKSEDKHESDDPHFDSAIAEQEIYGGDQVVIHGGQGFLSHSSHYSNSSTIFSSPEAFKNDGKASSTLHLHPYNFQIFAMDLLHPEQWSVIPFEYWIEGTLFVEPSVTPSNFSFSLSPLTSDQLSFPQPSLSQIHPTLSLLPPQKSLHLQFSYCVLDFHRPKLLVSPVRCCLTVSLEPQSTTGKSLSGVLQNQLQTFYDAVLVELNRDAAFARPNLSLDSSEVCLHKRIAKLKDAECQLAIEDALYMIILFKFSEIRVPLVPNLCKCFYHGYTIYLINLGQVSLSEEDQQRAQELRLFDGNSTLVDLLLVSGSRTFLANDTTNQPYFITMDGMDFLPTHSLDMNTIVLRVVIALFCFDPGGTLWITASIHEAYARTSKNYDMDTKYKSCPKGIYCRVYFDMQDISVPKAVQQLDGWHNYGFWYWFV